MSMQDKYIAEETQWLDENRNAYREGMENMADPAYVRGLLRGVEEKIAPILSYNPNEDPPHSAVFIIAAVQARMERLLTQMDFMDDYEQRRKDLNATISNVESHDTEDQSGDPGEIGEL